MVTGCARSATLGMVGFHRLFGIQALHQNYTPPALLRFAYYNPLKPPKQIANYINAKIARLQNSTQDHFEASYDFGNFIYGFSKYELLDIVISIRDPAYVCGSLMAYGAGKMYSDIIQPASLYIFHYMRLLQQVRLMDKKPRWIEFNDYVKGKYNSAFFKYFNIPDIEPNHYFANTYLKNKINHHHSYKIKEHILFEAGRKLADQIREESNEFS